MRIYTGILGQIGDIVIATAACRRLKDTFPEAEVTFAIASRFAGMADLLSGLALVDRIFITVCYFERLTQELAPLWEEGLPVDLRGNDEVEEQGRHELVFETRPRHLEAHWWEKRHIVEETARNLGVPRPVDLRTEIAIPPDVRCPEPLRGKIVFHNDAALSELKQWPVEHAGDFIAQMPPESVIVMGSSGPAYPGAIDLRKKTTLVEAAAIIRECRCFVGIDSAPMWIAGSLQVPTVGLYGTAHLPRPAALQPLNPQATYLECEGRLENLPVERVLRAVSKWDS